MTETVGINTDIHKGEQNIAITSQGSIMPTEPGRNKPDANNCSARLLKLHSDIDKQYII